MRRSTGSSLTSSRHPARAPTRTASIHFAEGSTQPWTGPTRMSADVVLHVTFTRLTGESAPSARLAGRTAISQLFPVRLAQLSSRLPRTPWLSTPGCWHMSTSTRLSRQSRPNRWSRLANWITPRRPPTCSISLRQHSRRLMSTGELPRRSSCLAGTAAAAAAAAEEAQKKSVAHSARWPPRPPCSLLPLPPWRRHSFSKDLSLEPHRGPPETDFQ
mmetsp:Transcript_40412/g.88357  ORF Transcript_40412/g.88357 Transcript_40412/m.88357 type:complete len:216 (+) Transcript_40412:695-1342(+)